MPGLGAVRGEALALARGSRVLFRNLEFEISAGEVLSVEGPNGAGKTSLLRLLAGFLQPLAGRCVVRTAAGDVADPEDRAQYVGWLGHQDGLKAQLTPVEALGFFVRYYGTGDIAPALQRVGLDRLRDVPVQYFSAGQKKRLALARLAITARPLWLLDEPLSSLDSGGRALVAEMITQHCEDGGIVIAATHEPLGVACQRLTLGATA